MGVNFGRVGFLTSLDRGRARRAAAGGARGPVRDRRPADHRAAPPGAAAHGHQRRAGHERDPGAHGGARLGGQRRRDGRARLRRRRGRHRGRLDGLQPLGRRADHGLGRRRDGAHVRRAARARRAAAGARRTATRSASRRTPSGSRPASSSTGTSSARWRRAASAEIRMGLSTRALAMLPDRPFLARYREHLRALMLERLVVSNLVVIRDADLQLGRGLNVADRRDRRRARRSSRGALDLALGGRTDSSLVGPNGRRGLRRGRVRAAARHAGAGGVRRRPRAGGRRGRAARCWRGAWRPTAAAARSPAGAPRPAPRSRPPARSWCRVVSQHEARALTRPGRAARAARRLRGAEAGRAPAGDGRRRGTAWPRRAGRWPRPSRTRPAPTA